MIQLNLSNWHKANKIENKDVEFDKLHRLGINSDNFVGKKVIKLTHKEGIKPIVKQKNKSIEPSVKLNLVSKMSPADLIVYTWSCVLDHWECNC